MENYLRNATLARRDNVVDEMEHELQFGIRRHPSDYGFGLTLDLVVNHQTAMELARAIQTKGGVLDLAETLAIITSWKPSE